MKTNRESTKAREMKRREQINYIMEHWDELPENAQVRFETTVSTIQDFVKQTTGPEDGGGGGSRSGERIA